MIHGPMDVQVEILVGLDSGQCTRESGMFFRRCCDMHSSPIGSKKLPNAPTREALMSGRVNHGIRECCSGHYRGFISHTLVPHSSSERPQTSSEEDAFTLGASIVSFLPLCMKRTI